MKILLVNERTGRQYEVLDRNVEAGTITLKGEAAVFTEKFDPAHFTKLGYVRKIIDDEKPAPVDTAEE